MWNAGFSWQNNYGVDHSASFNPLQLLFEVRTKRISVFWQVEDAISAKVYELRPFSKILRRQDCFNLTVLHPSGSDGALFPTSHHSSSFCCGCLFRSCHSSEVEDHILPELRRQRAMPELLSQNRQDNNKNSWSVSRCCQNAKTSYRAISILTFSKTFDNSVIWMAFRSADWIRKAPAPQLKEFLSVFSWRFRVQLTSFVKCYVFFPRAWNSGKARPPTWRKTRTKRRFERSLFHHHDERSVEKRSEFIKLMSERS